MPQKGEARGPGVPPEIVLAYLHRRGLSAPCQVSPPDCGASPTGEDGGYFFLPLPLLPSPRCEPRE